MIITCFHRCIGLLAAAHTFHKVAHVRAGKFITAGIG
jgi:hypothetical protein